MKRPGETWAAWMLRELAELEVRELEARSATIAGRLFLRMGPIHQENIRQVAALDGVTVEAVVLRRIPWVEQRRVRPAARAVRS